MTTATPEHVCVTGCAGFIGWKVTAFLLAQGCMVTGIDNLNDSYDIRLKQWRLGTLQSHARFAFHPLDVRDHAALLQVVEDQKGGDGPPITAMISLAGRAGVRESVRNPWAYVDTNVTGTLNALDVCRQCGVMKFVLSSTSSLYGADAPRPFREDASTDRPLSPYAASKKAAEAFCYTYSHLYGLDVSVLRYFTVYGPAGRPDMSPLRFVRWISEGQPVVVYGDGTQERDFTYVDDIARGTIAALRPTGYEVINLGSDAPIPLSQIIRLVEKLTGKQATVEYQDWQPADSPATWADTSKARRLLGWQPRVSIEEGLSHLVQWYRENRRWAVDLGW
jgi:UDP-glucuronate 4-epimerase